MTDFVHVSIDTSGKGWHFFGGVEHRRPRWLSIAVQHGELERFCRTVLPVFNERVLA